MYRPWGIYTSFFSRARDTSHALTPMFWKRIPSRMSEVAMTAMKVPAEKIGLAMACRHLAALLL